MIKSKSIAKYSILLAILVCIGKILGFIKQSVIASEFGANIATDLFFAADGYTSTIAQILSMSIAPTVLTAYLLVKNKKSKQDANNLINKSLVFFFLISIVLMALSVVFSSKIANLVGISYTQAQKQTLASYVIILSLVIVFSSVAGTLQGYLNANNRYVPGRLAGFFYSVSIICSILFFKKTIGVSSLVVGFLLGYLFHTIYLIICARKVIKIPHCNLFFDIDFKRMLSNFASLLISVSIVDFGHLIDRIIASSLEEGSVSILNYGQVISSDLVNAVIITTISTVLFTSFTDSVTKGESKESIVSNVRNILGTMALLVVLLTVLYCVEGRDLVEVLLQRGNFNASNTDSVSKVAFFYSVGFLFMAVREVLVKVHYAYQDMKAPVINSVIGVITNLVLSIILSKVIGVSGIALATSISLAIVSVFSMFTLRKHVDALVIDNGLSADFFKIIICGLTSFCLGIVIKNVVIELPHMLRMIIVGLSMCMIYFVTGFIVRERSVLKYSKAAIYMINKK